MNASRPAVHATGPAKVLILGATGAVGTAALQALQKLEVPVQVTTLARRTLAGLLTPNVTQHTLNVMDPAAYAPLLQGHDAAICTLGVGEPSTVSRETFVRVDQLAVLDFAIACRQAGVRHFQLLSSIGVDAHSHNFFLRKKGELNDALVALGFERLSLFQPSMILTPTNRYGFSQAVTLAVWPRLHGLMRGRLEKARGRSGGCVGRSHGLQPVDRGARCGAPDLAKLHDTDRTGAALNSAPTATHAVAGLQSWPQKRPPEGGLPAGGHAQGITARP